MTRAGAGGPVNGFSLVEVMVALLVISVGLLGIAKMQALALSSTGTARLRSLAALEAASLASAMRADRAYWAASAVFGTPDLVINVNNGVVTNSTDAALNPPATVCTSAATPCTATQMAAYDLQDWAVSLSAPATAATPGVIPGGSALVTCTMLPTNASPVSCRIQVTWTENLVAANSQEKGGATAMAKSQYTLYVQP